VTDVRADKWLWAARFWKTRSQAALALREGKVMRDGVRCDPSTAVRVGDELVARTPGGKKVLFVRALSGVRGGAEVARLLYEDRTPPEPDVEPTALREAGAGRPTKRDRREIERLRG
jgi:ribosome-associated heat shock protein Hsp15